ncbi:MAG: hypothetical protein PHC62_00340 [Candidatus Izemoplasmatales bacterium]|nr:hypothetical protein [Candidatus Izemoplasmatales bacterium]
MENKIVYIMGKSGVGKNSIYDMLLGIMKNKNIFKNIIMNTTRPMRDGEKEGKDYFFVTQEQFREDKDSDKILELRSYSTIYGDWSYYTSKDAINLENHSYMGIGTLISYHSLVKHYGKDSIIPIYIQVPDEGDRLLRSISRERNNGDPNYKEICRRFLADEDDFSAEKIAEVDPHIFKNKSQVECVYAIRTFLLDYGIINPNDIM